MRILIGKPPVQFYVLQEISKRGNSIEELCLCFYGNIKKIYILKTVIAKHYRLLSDALMHAD